jgi:hypothetical protein
MDEFERIAAFLGANHGAFCDECLGDRLGLPRDEVKTAIFTLAKDFARRYGHCRGCRRSTAVTSQRLVA